MPERLFDIDELDNLDLWDGSKLVKLAEEVDSGRWSKTTEIVFTAEDDGKDYLVYTEEGLTENQDYYGSYRYPDSFSAEDDRWWVSCPEVETFQVMEPVTKWRKV